MARRPSFPTHEHLTHLSRDDAERALSALRVLVKYELADVYTSAGSHDRDWMVWSNIRWRRFTLAEWCAEWLTSLHGREGGPEGGDAA